ncbi:MAG: ribbon-helix-helix protein, CopG family [Polyangiaceae bacterium]
MSELVRFGVAMDRELLGRFDARIAAAGYENRSEALRDLVRADLTRAAWSAGGVVVGTLTLVCNRKVVGEVALALDAPSADADPALLARTSVRVDAHRSLEVAVLRGNATQLQALAGRVSGMRGVLASELTLACAFER